MSSRQVGATTANLIADEIRLGTRYKEAAEKSEYYRELRVNRVIGETIRACNSALGMGGNFKNGCLYREAGLSEFWRKGNGESVVCDHAVPISELINWYKEGESLERLAFSPVVRISTAANEELTRAGYAKSGFEAGLPLYRYSRIGLSIVTHDGALVDPAMWTDDDHWKLVMSTAELRPVLSALSIFHQSGSEIAEAQKVSSVESKAQYLLKTWGKIFKERGFGTESSIDDFDGLLSLIERMGGFDPDDPESEFYGDAKVFDEFKDMISNEEAVDHL